MAAFVVTGVMVMVVTLVLVVVVLVVVVLVVTLQVLVMPTLYCQSSRADSLSCLLADWSNFTHH